MPKSNAAAKVPSDYNPKSEKRREIVLNARDMTDRETLAVHPYVTVHTKITT